MRLIIIMAVLLCAGCSRYEKGDCVLISEKSSEISDVKQAEFVEFANAAYWVKIEGKLHAVVWSSVVIKACEEQ